VPTLAAGLDAPPTLVHITVLDLRRNNLKRLPDVLDPVGCSLLVNLRTLLLRGNSLKAVPPGWLGGGRDDDDDLDGVRGGGGGEGEGGGGVTQGVHYKQTARGCAWTFSLEHVDLRLNKLDALPHTIGALTSLTTLLVGLALPGVRLLIWTILAVIN
jgi:Leucine-rich repeat (LRR) protein